MICNVCGFECADGSQSCPRCGKNFLEEPSLNDVPVSTPATSVTAAPPRNESKVSLILGIIAVVSNFTLGCFCSCLGGIPGIICAIIGLVMGSKEKKTNPTNKSSSVGMILCIVSFIPVLLWLVYMILVLILYGVAGLGMMVEGVSF